MQGQPGKCKMQNAECRIKRPDGKRQTIGNGLSAFENRRRPFCILHSAFYISARGQAMAEYVIIAGLLMASLGILTVFFVTFQEYSGRILALVSSEYP